jgi:ABC-type cobalamin/Fe3+-siderophores transport system ATPase subunit
VANAGSIDIGRGLRLDRVSFTYMAGRPVVTDVSFAVRTGELLAVIGPNGCGKSTVLKLMAGLMKPSGGEILLDDLAVQSLPRRALARRLAMLSQSNEAPDGMIVRDLVGLGRFAHEGWLRRDTPEDRRHIDDAMRRMDVETLAECRVGELSGGQLQRCRMAMTLAQDTRILLLDEPTNHLDLRHQYALLDVARAQARHGRAVVAVLHDLTLASLYADRIILMSQGRVAAEGAPIDVLSQERVEAVYGIRTVAMPFGRAVVHLPEGALR